MKFQIPLAWALIACCWLLPSTVQAACIQTDDDGFDSCIRQVADEACEALQGKLALYEACWETAATKAVLDSGMLGNALNLVIRQDGKNKLVEGTDCKKLKSGRIKCIIGGAGGFLYSCTRINANYVSECEGDEADNLKCKRRSCPVASCKMVCSPHK